MRHFYFVMYPLLFGLSLGQANFFSRPLPDCASACFERMASDSSCFPTDLTCLCGDPAFMSALQSCESTDCTVKEVLTSTNITQSACGAPTGDISKTLVGIAASFGSLAILLYILRILDRLCVVKVSLGPDDYYLTLGVILGSTLNFLVYPMVDHGLGRDIWTVSFPDINITLELLYIAEVVYFPSEMFTQLSILAFYRRVFAKSSSVIQTGSILLMVCVVLFGVANTLTIIFQCTPIPFFWTGWTGETSGSCIDINAFSWARAGIEIAIDVAILSLPLRDVTQLQMSWKKKAQVTSVFVLGFIITIVSILRLQSLVHFAETTNVTHDNAFAVYWSVLECDVFIIAACLPSIRSIILRFAPRWFGKSETNENYFSGSRKYHRQHDAESGQNTSPHQSRHHYTQGGILKSVDLQISHGSTNAGDDIELLNRHPGVPYGA